METLAVSVKERRRLVVLGQVHRGLLRLRAAAEQLDEQLDLSYRQVRRVYLRLKSEGDKGLAHRLRGRPGNRANDPALRGRVVELYRQRYGGFGCTLACEHLAEDNGLVIDDQTLRRWLMAAAMLMLRRWAMRHGLPGELHPDRDSIYRRNDQEADQIEARTGRRPLTQFGRAMAQLGVKLTCAKSPQAKGRVERMNGTLQDRLVKELRLAGISDIAAANEFLDRRFLPRLNERFTVEPSCAADAHRPVSEAELTAASSVKEDRLVARDQCVSWQGRVLQLMPGAGLPSLAGETVTVCQHLDATVTVHWPGRTVPHRPLAARPPPAMGTLPQRLAYHAPTCKPPTDHPLAPLYPRR